MLSTTASVKVKVLVQRHQDRLRERAAESRSSLWEMGSICPSSFRLRMRFVRLHKERPSDLHSEGQRPNISALYNHT